MISIIIITQVLAQNIGMHKNTNARNKSYKKRSGFVTVAISIYTKKQASESSDCERQ